MEAIRKTSAFLFFALGILTIIAIVLLNRGILVHTSDIFLSIVDLPLLLAGVFLGGSSVVLSLSKQSPSLGLAITVFTPLLLIFLFFCYLNFALPFSAA